jgi:hypothetical protein
MEKENSKLPEFNLTTPPEFPPGFPINPPETPNAPKVSVPMIYVDERERIEYRVKAFEVSAPENLEAELNAQGREGWQLVSIIPKEKQVLLIFSRRAET